MPEWLKILLVVAGACVAVAVYVALRDLSKLLAYCDAEGPLGRCELTVGHRPGHRAGGQEWGRVVEAKREAR